MSDTSTGGPKVTNKKGQSDGPETFTTARLYTADTENLKELADKRKLSMAEMYRALGFSEVVRLELVNEAEKRLKDLKSQRPQ
jgi:hypothetical protein